MNTAEAMRLLARCAAFDNRRPNESAAQAWAAALHDVPMDADAVAAVARYYGTPPENPDQRKWIEPHHVRSLRAKIREERMSATGDIPGPGLPAAVPDADPDDVRGYLAALREGRTRTASGGELRQRPVLELIAGVGRRVEPGEPYLPDGARAELAATIPRFARRNELWPELAVACPKSDCRAPAFSRCVSPSGARLREHTHHSRRAAWATSVAVCPACQVAPGTPCRDEEGRAIPDLIHPERDREAVATRTNPAST